MVEFSNELIKIIRDYREIEKNKNRLEDKTAFVMMNAKYYENVRHTLSHLIAALELEIERSPGNEQKINEQYIHARKHMSDLDVNGYEFLAGVFLTDLREKIEKSGFFSVVGRAENLLDEALKHFDKGRDLRVAKKEQGMEQFEKCIDLCMEGQREIVPVTRTEKMNVRINVTALVLSVISIVVVILIAVFKS